MTDRRTSPLSACLAATAVLMLIPAAQAAPTSNVRELSRQGKSSLQALYERELRAARGQRQEVIVMFTADWCTPCRSIKELLHDSAPVKAATRRGRFLLVDVDAWRGPAQKLIEGVDTSKLPLLVRVDREGRAVVSCHGTELGLLTEASVAHNLGRLLEGKPPEPPAYEATPEDKREALREFARRQQAEAPRGPELELAVRSRKAAAGGASEWKVRLTLRNPDARRRWYVIPSALGDQVPDAPDVSAQDLMKFDEHVRATWLRFGGQPGFAAIPVGGHGTVVLDDWPLRVPRGRAAAALEVRVLDRLLIAGKAQPIQKKLPYALEIARGSASRSLRATSAPGPVKLVGAKRLSAKPAPR